MTEQRVQEIRASYIEQTTKELFFSILTNIELECGRLFSKISICREDIHNYMTLGGIVKNRGAKLRKYLVFTFEQELLMHPINLFSVLESTVGSSATMLIRGMILLKKELCVTAKRNEKQWTLSLTCITITCRNWNEFVITCFEIGLVPVIIVYENSKLLKGIGERYEKTLSISELMRGNIRYLESKMSTESESLKTPNDDAHDYAVNQRNSPHTRETAFSVDRVKPPLSDTRSLSVSPPRISRFNENKKRGGKKNK